MKAKLTKKAVALFENIKKIDEDGREYWSSRELAKILEYKDYRNFLTVINKAKESCSNSNIMLTDHFVGVTDMVSIGSGAIRTIETIRLSRYACYLTVQNADPSKTIVAQAQTYFAIQTRIAEVKQMEEYNQLTSEDETQANQTHYDVGKKVRQTIEDLGGTMPEDLPTAESIKTIEAKQQKEIKD